MKRLDPTICLCSDHHVSKMTDFVSSGTSNLAPSIHAVITRMVLLHTPQKKGSPYLITECRVPKLILVLGSQPAGDVSRKPGCRLPLLSARPTVTPATLKRAATNFGAW